jgi:hypothetical protein
VAPVILQVGREFTVNVTIEEVIDPQAPVTTTLYVLALAVDTGEMV